MLKLFIFFFTACGMFAQQSVPEYINICEGITSLAPKSGFTFVKWGADIQEVRDSLGKRFYEMPDATLIEWDVRDGLLQLFFKRDKLTRAINKHYPVFSFKDFKSDFDEIINFLKTKYNTKKISEWEYRFTDPNCKKRLIKVLGFEKGLYINVIYN